MAKRRSSGGEVLGNVYGGTEQRFCVFELAKLHCFASRFPITAPFFVLIHTGRSFPIQREWFERMYFKDTAWQLFRLLLIPTVYLIKGHGAQTL